MVPVRHGDRTAVPGSRPGGAGHGFPDGQRGAHISRDTLVPARERQQRAHLHNGERPLRPRDLRAAGKRKAVLERSDDGGGARRYNPLRQIRRQVRISYGVLPRGVQHSREARRDDKAQRRRRGGFLAGDSRRGAGAGNKVRGAPAGSDKRLHEQSCVHTYRRPRHR